MKVMMERHSTAMMDPAVAHEAPVVRAGLDPRCLKSAAYLSALTAMQETMAAQAAEPAVVPAQQTEAVAPEFSPLAVAGDLYGQDMILDRQ